jgi:hypothetical protein
MVLCANCGKRAVTPRAGAGRRSPYKNFGSLEIPWDLEIPTCGNCGAEWIDRKTAARIDAALGEVAARELSARAREALEVLAASFNQGDLEAQLGLSAGYLSKVKHGKETPSSWLVAALAMLSVSPRRLDEVAHVWANGRLPPRITANQLTRVEATIDTTVTVAN